MQYNLRGIERLASVAIAGAAVVVLIAACADDGGRICRVGADCASGACGPDGQCVPDRTKPAGDGSSGGDGSPDAAIANDAGDASVPGCTPKKDGIITREEVPIAAGLHATYKIGKDEDVSTAGTLAAGGRRTWDFSGALASDVGVLVETQALAGKWYAAKFPGATYASRLQQSSDLIGVFETSPGALLLRGVVSPTEAAATKTELTNTPPVAILSFPLKLGTTWTTNAKVSGTAQGVALFGTYDEKYESKVDAAGELKTPLGTFEVLRVEVLLTRTIGVLAPTTLRTFAFVTECYGTIASVTSAQNEATVEFTHAAEIRRIAP